jgi:hypothetical protein
MVAKFRLAGLVILTLLVGGLIGVAATLAIDNEPAGPQRRISEQTSEQIFQEPTPGPGAAAPRIAVEWCIDVPRDDTALETAAIEAISRHIPELVAAQLADRIHDVQPRVSVRGHGPDAINATCPSTASAYDRGAYFTGTDDELYMEVFGRLVTSPGRYSVMIWVLPDDHIDRLFGRTGYRLGEQERICQGDLCEGVTHALYLGVNELTDPAFLRYWLYALFNLACSRPEDALPPGFQNPVDCP